MIRGVPEQLAQKICRFHTAGAWSLFRQNVSTHDVERQIQLRFVFRRVFRKYRAQPSDIGVVGFMLRGDPPAGYGDDIHLFDVGRLAGNGGQFLSAFCGFDRARFRPRDQPSNHFVQIVDLETRAVVAGRHHRDSPLRHRRIGIKRRSLQETALRFARPEGMQLRHALVEELLRFGVRSRDRKVYLALAGENLRGQRGRDSAGRRDAQIAAGFLGLSGGQTNCQQHEKYLAHSFILAQRGLFVRAGFSWRKYP